MGSFLSFALFVFTVNTHYRLATAWHPSRRVAAREMGGKNAWTTRNDGYPSCVYSITPFSLLFMIFLHFVLQFFVGMGPVVLCSSAMEIVEKGKRSGYQRLFFFLFLFSLYISSFSRELKRR
ncbi:hypothetical protein LX32DRAFT_264923 [Colletotrichum zoysiae]|uniref:Uncharacterized protein n=1 Tax=Colletotrichum zoysiae TaxID=1216348 RepID=A0AAD9H2X3_9PEZI|nr:hypothetical protein LX32DRAFT_264923 [Colletotrichum zoysiae]